MPSRSSNNRRSSTSKSGRSQPQPQASSHGSSSLSRAAADVLMDVPHFSSDERSLGTLDSLDVTAQFLKGNLNASYREGQERLRSSGKGSATSGRSGRSGDRGGGGTSGKSSNSNSFSSSNSSGRGSHKNGKMKGPGGSLVRGGSSLNAEHVDVPHLDDILRAAATKVQARDGLVQSAVTREIDRVVSARGGGADAAGGGLDRSGPVDWASCAKSTNPTGNSVGSGGSDGSGGSSSGTSNNSHRRGKNGAIIVEDEESAGSHSLRGSFSGGKDPSSRSLELDMPTLSEANRNRRRSSIFESLWGSSARNVTEPLDASHDAARRDSDTSSDGESRSMKLMRTISGRVGFQRGSDSYDNNPPPRYYGTNCVNSIRGFVSTYAKLTTVCILVGVALAATVGALVVLVPLWMESEERGESGELGGMAYGGNDEIKMNGGGGGQEGPTETGFVGDEGGMEATDNIDDSSANAGSSGKLRPPPYNLQLLCSHASISEPGGYEKCVSACLPSRCCLVPEHDPYEVWTLHGITSTKSSGLSGLKPTSDLPAIGTKIPSCFHHYPDTCVHYYNQCSILGTSVLLPRKPPSAKEVADMNEGKKLELAEWINHACSKVRTGGNDSECKMLCENKDCCFATDEKEKLPVHPALEGTNGIGRTKETTSDTLISNGFVEMSHVFSVDDPNNGGAMVQYNDYAFDLDRPNTPTGEPTSALSTIWPTPAGSSYHPTPTDTVMRRLVDGAGVRRQQKLDTDGSEKDVVHMAIPGEEDFVYVVGSPESMGEGEEALYGESTYGGAPGGENDSAAMEPAEGETTPVVQDTSYREPEAEPVKVPTFQDGEEIQQEDTPKTASTNGKNCQEDTKRHCITYAGCAPLFGN